MSKKALAHLRRDHVMKGILAGWKPSTLNHKENILLYLCMSIISQQLSTKVARILCDRFIDLYTGTNPTTKAILATPDFDLRSIGLSASKVAYIKNVCIFFEEHKLSDASLHRLSDDEVIALLIQIKGVGRWTIEMLLIFAMGREDVFSVDDLGIRKAMMTAYKIKEGKPKEVKTAMLELSESWRPYRSFACLALWQWKDLSELR